MINIMSRSRSALWFVVLSWLLLFNELTLGGPNDIDYKGALIKSLLYFEAQRSGALPQDQRVLWRADSALRDGQSLGIDLSGGYYDAGDNLKLGFPLAFTITMLSWSIIEFEQELKANNELANAIKALRWGTDYLLKANPESQVLYAEVGDPDSDHQCWQRPEDMTTPRTVFRIDSDHPGSDLAAESAAAFAAASIALSSSDPTYAASLLDHAKGLYDFASSYEGIYSNSIPEAAKIYSSSGYKDEMTWAAIWLYSATDADEKYLDDITDDGGARPAFSWDDKFVGAQVMVAKNIWEGMIGGEVGPDLGSFKSQAEQFICSCIQKGNRPFKKTPGGLLWFMPWNNMQYVATATFVTTVYSKYLTTHSAMLQCSDGPVSPSDLISSARSQVDYILGNNPIIKSFMVGFGSNFPVQVHHRGASIISIKKDPAPVTCQGGFDVWYNRNESNPNVLDGAIVSPDENDGYTDSRSNYQFTEPTTATTAPLVGVLAYFATL